MKRSKKILSIFLCGVIGIGCFALGGCKKTPPEQPYTPPEVQPYDGSMPNVKRDVPLTQTVFVDKGKTDYVIVLEREAEALRFAESELKARFEEATGGQLTSMLDPGNLDGASGKYISLGNTSLVPSTADRSVATLGAIGYTVKTSGDDVLIYASSLNGVVNGVYELLQDVFNYRYYAPDIWQIDDCSTETVMLPNFDVTDRPDVDMPIVRLEGAPNPEELKYRLRGTNMNETIIPINGVAYHTSMATLPPSIYRNKNRPETYHPEFYMTNVGDRKSAADITDGMREKDKYTYSTQDAAFANGDGHAQLCYNAHGDAESRELMIDLQVETLKEAILNNPVCKEDPTRKMYIWYTQMDNRVWCACDACQADKDKYGANAASYVKMANEISEKLQAWIVEENKGRQIDLLIFSYLATETAPNRVDEAVELGDHVALMYAPINATYQWAMTDPRNQTYNDTLLKWEAISNDDAGLTLWIYNHTWFNDYLCPFYSFGAMQENIRYFLDHNAKMIYSQNQYDQATMADWGNLKIYLDTQLQWDCDQSVETLVENYFTVVYRAAAPKMLEYFGRYCAHMEYMLDTTGFDGYYTDSSRYFRDEEHFPYREVCRWLDLIDEAYDAAEVYREDDPALYRRLRDSICLESLMPRHVILEAHGEHYTGEEFVAFEAAIEADRERLGVSFGSEGGHDKWY